MTMTNQQLKSIAAAVIIQAAKDYQKHPEMRDSIEGWIKEGNLYVEAVLPDFTEDDIIKKLRETLHTQPSMYLEVAKRRERHAGLS